MKFYVCNVLQQISLIFVQHTTTVNVKCLLSCEDSRMENGLESFNVRSVSHLDIFVHDAAKPNIYPPTSSPLERNDSKTCFKAKCDNVWGCWLKSKCVMFRTN